MRLGGRALVRLPGDAVLPAGLPLAQTAGETSYSCLPFFFFRLEVIVCLAVGYEPPLS